MGNEKWDMGNGEMKKWGNGDGNDTTDYYDTIEDTIGEL